MCRFYLELLLLLLFKKTSLVYNLNVDESEVQLANIIDVPAHYRRPTQPEGSCLLYNCTITCYNGSYEDLEMKLNNTLSFTQSCPTIEKLQLQNYEFPNGTVPKLCLGQFQNKVRSFILSNSYVVNMEMDAFKNGSFEQITLENLQLYELRANYFQNMSHDLTSLTITQKTNQTINFIEKDFLWFVKRQLKVLRLYMNAKSVQNFIATEGLENLRVLDLQYNDLANRLKFNTFMKLNALEYLNLSKSKISFLPSLIFSYIMDTLLYLDISGNHLTTLWPMMFGYQQIPATPTINAQDNPYTCSCQLYNHFLQLFPQLFQMYCKNPYNNNELILINVTLCIWEDGNDRNLVELTTTKASEIFFAQNYCNELLESTKFHIQQQTAHGFIFLNADTYYFYKFERNDEISKNTENFTINYVTFEENVPYTVCLIYNEDLEVNPLDCMSSYKREQAVVERAWLTESDKLTTISVVLSAIFALMFVGIGVTFIIIRKRPSLIKDSESIIRPKYQTNNIPVLPKHASEKLLMPKENVSTNAKSHVQNYGMREDFLSMNSLDSYMCENIYELVPAYLKIREEPFSFHSCCVDVEETYNGQPLIDTADHPPTYAFASPHQHDSNDPIPQLPPPPPLAQVPSELNNIINQSAFSGQSDIYDFYKK